MRDWISLFESSEPSLTFNSREDAWIMNAFGVHGTLLGDPEQCLGISEFSSTEGGKGNAEKALRWLKTQTPLVHVYDPGEEDTDSYTFWRRMAEKGLVDSMEDEDGNVIYQDGEWVTQLDEGESFTTRYWKNPSRTQLLKLVERHDELRAASDGTNVWVWHSFDVVHAMAIRELGLTSGKLCFYVAWKDDVYFNSASSQQLTRIGDTEFAFASLKKSWADIRKIPWVQSILKA